MTLLALTLTAVPAEIAAFEHVVVKVDLATFERVDVLDMVDTEHSAGPALIDPAGEFAYFGTAEFMEPGQVVKIDLETFERVGAI